MLKVDTNIPIPERKADSSTMRSVLQSMSIGDSFLIERAKEPYARCVASSLGFKLIGRAQPEGQTRIWLSSKGPTVGSTAEVPAV